MKYYRDNQNHIYAYESDGSQDAYIKPDLREITEEEATDIRNAGIVIPKPTVLTRKQAKSILFIKGLLSHVQPAISAIPDPFQKGMAQIAWDDATEFKRNDPILMALSGMLGLSDTQLDELFQEGSVL